MNNKDFQTNALRTESNDFPAIRERLANPAVATMLLSTLNTLMEVGTQLDALKKYVYYGKDKTGNIENFIQHKFPMMEQGFKIVVDQYVGEAQKLTETDKNIRFLHGVMGINTEGVELVEALVNICKGNEVDAVNVMEEVGDVNWYEAIIADAFDFDIDVANVRVINKLKARFPEKFDEGHAVNRDLGTEREILEGGQNA